MPAIRVYPPKPAEKKPAEEKPVIRRAIRISPLPKPKGKSKKKK
jgi:hypothetical protein